MFRDHSWFAIRATPRRERSACGWRDRLISREDAAASPAAWAHAVDIDGAKLHYHKRSTELYYILEGSGSILLDGVEQPVSKGSLVHIPPGVLHGLAVGCGFWWLNPRHLRRRLLRTSTIATFYRWCPNLE